MQQIPLMMPGIVETPFVLSELKNLHKRNGLTIIKSGGIDSSSEMLTQINSESWKSLKKS